MADDDAPRKDADNDEGLRWDGRDRQFSLGRTALQALLEHNGTRWIFAAIAWSIGIIGTCYALSLIL